MKIFFFIKKLTKAAANILKNEPKSLEPFLERLFIYHGEGVQKADELIARGNNSSQIRTLKGHLLNHNSHFCMALYQQTDDVFWAKEVFFNSFTLFFDS